MSGRFKTKPVEPIAHKPAAVIGQMDLAKILECQQRIALVKLELGEHWKTVREDLRRGATIEPGPLKAFFESSMIIRGDKTRTHKRMRVI